MTFNTAVGRARERHLRNDPRVSVSVLDPGNAFRFVSVSGTPSRSSKARTRSSTAWRRSYLGVDAYPYRQPGEQRITVRVAPEKAISSAGAAIRRASTRIAPGAPLLCPRVFAIPAERHRDRHAVRPAVR